MMDYWRKKYLLPAINSGASLALIGIGDNPEYFSDRPISTLAEIWDPARIAVSSQNYCIYDIDPQLVEIALSRKIRAKVCDLCQAELDQQYDFIFASDVIEHVTDPLSFLLNLGNSLAPGGKIIITTPNALYWRNFLTGYRHEHPDHNFTFASPHLLNLARKAGLKPVEIGSFQTTAINNPLQALIFPVHFMLSYFGRGNSLLACLTSE